MPSLPIAENFEATNVPPELHEPPVGHILYVKPVAEIDLVKKVLKVRTNKEAGEKTFEFFLKTECEE